MVATISSGIFIPMKILIKYYKLMDSFCKGGLSQEQVPESLIFKRGWDMINIDEPR
jgi:hypothetical protein